MKSEFYDSLVNFLHDRVLARGSITTQPLIPNNMHPKSTFKTYHSNQVDISPQIARLSRCPDSIKKVPVSGLIGGVH